MINFDIYNFPTNIIPSFSKNSRSNSFHTRLSKWKFEEQRSFSFIWRFENGSRYFNPSEVKFQELSKISRNVPLPVFLNKKGEKKKKETVKITFSRSRDPISTHVSKFFRRTKGERENHVSIHETIHEKWPRRGLGSKEKGRLPPLFPLKSANESKILNEPL